MPRPRRWYVGAVARIWRTKGGVLGAVLGRGEVVGRGEEEMEWGVGEFARMTCRDI